MTRGTDFVIGTVGERFQDTMSPAIDIANLSKIEIAVGTMYASSRRDYRSVVTTSDRRKQTGYAIQLMNTSLDDPEISSRDLAIIIYFRE